MFETLIVRPIFNLLEFIYALIPGHDLGIAIIIFTALVRLALWPLVKKQLHHAQAMRKLQPELKKLKKAAAGDRQKEARLQMELYKERGIKPLASIGTLVIQIPIFIGLYQAVLKIINNPHSLVDLSYSFVRDLPWIHQLAGDIHKFDASLLGLVDLTRRGVEAGGAGIYLPAVVVAILSTIMQYKQTKMMMQSNQDSRKLSIILKEAAAGKETDQSEVTAAISKVMLYFLPIVTFFFALVVPSALSLYLLTSSTVGYFQQRRVFNQDAEEMHEIAGEDSPETVKSPKTVAKVAPEPDGSVSYVNGLKVTISTSGSSASNKKSPATKTKNKTSSKKKRRR
jgi:YidC/Oxa1 family membrane protein insertase